MEKKPRGGKREGAGRKPKAEEQQLIEKLTPLEDLAFRALETAMLDIKAQSWAIPLYFNYRYGRPTQKIDAKLDTSINKKDIQNIFPDEETEI